MQEGGGNPREGGGGSSRLLDGLLKRVERQEREIAAARLRLKLTFEKLTNREPLPPMPRRPPPPPPIQVPSEPSLPEAEGEGGVKG